MKTFFLLNFLFITHLLTAQGLTPEQKHAIDSLFKSDMAPGKPGTAIAVVRNDEVIYTGTFGSADISNNKRITGQTNFWIASVSKQFTALAISLLEKAGRVSVDDAVAKYIPELKRFPEVRIKHLLHHRSGLRDGYTLVGMTLRGEKHFDPQSVLGMMARQKALNFAPGSRFEYVNSNYVLLALIVQRVSGKTFDKFMKEDVFLPLGLQNARVYNGEENADDAKGYYPSKGKLKQVKHFIPAQGSSGVLLSLNDVVTFEKLYHRKERPSIITAMESGFADNITSAYRRGVEKYTVENHTVISHFGSDPGFRADILRLPEEKISVVIFSNAGNYWALGKHLFYIAGVALNDPVLMEFGSPVVEQAAPAEAKALQGVYFDSTTHELRFIQYQNNILKASSSLHGYYKPLNPVSADEFSTQEVYEFTYKFERRNLKVNDVSKKHQFIKIDSTSFTDDVKRFKGAYYSEELNKKYRITYRHGRLRLTFFHLLHATLHPIGANTFYASFSGDNVLQFVQSENGQHRLLFSREGIRRLTFVKKTPRC